MPTILLTYEGVHINKQTRLGGLLTRCCCMTEQLNIKLRNFMLDNTQNMAMAALQQQQAFDTSHICRKSHFIRAIQHLCTRHVYASMIHNTFNTNNIDKMRALTLSISKMCLVEIDRC